MASRNGYLEGPQKKLSCHQITLRGKAQNQQAVPCPSPEIRYTASHQFFSACKDHQEPTAGCGVVGVGGGPAGDKAEIMQAT